MSVFPNWQCEVVGGARDGDVMIVFDPHPGMLVDSQGLGLFEIQSRGGVLVAVWQGEPSIEDDGSEDWKR